MLHVLFLILGILAITAEVFLISAWILPRFLYEIKEKPGYHPKTCIIVPCKGVEKNFKENIEAICNQRYNNYETVFVIDSMKDPAYRVLNKLFRYNPKVKIKTSNALDGCSGKISALITGVRAAGNVDIYVFADSDIKPHRDWLSHLTSPLQDKKVGATTGYRWFFPYNVKSLLLSTWNMAGSASLFYPMLNFAWGGSTAITRALFHELDIETRWKNGYSDDLILTKAVKKAGYQVRFIPQCIVESPIDDTISSFIRWGTRQFMWVRWYYPSAWALSFVGSVGVKLITCLGLFLLITGFTFPGILMISTIFLEMICGWQAITTLKKTMLYPEEKFGSTFYYAAMMPIAFFILAYNNLVSCFKKEIKWGGRIYRKPY
jgi:cellulose synthase/poly-beta-1,6-N-acetylglucosamine synthase-like glycosyltransferase